MNRIFLQFGSGLGPMSRSLPIALALAEAGYEIKYLGYDMAKTHMKKAGIEELCSDFGISDIKKGSPNPQWSTADEFWSMIGYGNMPWVERKVDELISLLKEFSPDYILSDLGILACIASRIMGIPLIAINQSCYHPNVKLKWWEDNYKFENYKSEDSLLYKLNAYLKKKGAPQLNTFTEIFTGNLTIIPSFYDFDPIQDVKKYNTHYVGPVLYIPKETASERVLKLFDAKKPIIFCYTARFYDNVGESGKVIFDNMIKIADKLDASIIISTGNKKDELLALDIASKEIKNGKVSIVDYVPLDVAYKKSDLIIHHGGHGSCLAQFYYGVPSVIIPTHTEREYNARMCEKLHVGKMVSRINLNSSNLKDSIDDVLNNITYKKSVCDWKEKVFNDFNNLDKVVKLIDSL
ncbi:glycosyltransferase [Acetivibrio straminisolvens]|uniref:glycosyltransferase n=2 Tax=Acetivibrio straminisolvens TaxID=253314 RepID=UPI00223E9B76|nr:nucleotide disphospho-sugar-binding domain-containing protein [Acetivibrio straminisolvens]